MKAKKLIAFHILAFTSFCCIAPLYAQVKWNVKLIHAGIYQVTILPEDTIKSVSFKASLISSSITTTIEKAFTNINSPELFPGFIYYKRYYCDTTIINVIGDMLTCFPSDELPTGALAMIGPIEARPSQWIPGIRNRIILEEDKTDPKTNHFPEVLPHLQSYYPNIHPNYKDLEEWLQENNSNKVQVEVTIINQSTSDGNYYYTAWGKSFLKKGIENEHFCLLITNPNVALFYSDRYYTVPENPKNLSQRFSFNNSDICSIKLDMAQNAIVLKSLTWSYEETFSDIRRTGNMIYGIKEGKMIVLNLLKK